MSKRFAHVWRESTRRKRARIVMMMIAYAVVVGYFSLKAFDVEISLGYPWARVLGVLPFILLGVAALDQGLEERQTRHLDPPREWFSPRRD